MIGLLAFLVLGGFAVPADAPPAPPPAPAASPQAPVADTRLPYPTSPEAVRRIVEEAMAAVSRAQAEAERRIAEAEVRLRAAEARLAALSAERNDLSERLAAALAQTSDLERGIAPDMADLRQRLAASETLRREAEVSLVAAQAEIRRLAGERPHGETEEVRPSVPGIEMPAETEPQDPNTASLESLERVPGVGPVRAKAILWYRERIARFGRIEDLIRVPGFDRNAVEAVRPHLRIRNERSTPRGGSE